MRQTGWDTARYTWDSGKRIADASSGRACRLRIAAVRGMLRSHAGGADSSAEVRRGLPCMAGTVGSERQAAMTQNSGRNSEKRQGRPENAVIGSLLGNVRLCDFQLVWLRTGGITRDAKPRPDQDALPVGLGCSWREAPRQSLSLGRQGTSAGQSR
jgi:hypothetical protein